MENLRERENVKEIGMRKNNKNGREERRRRVKIDSEG